MSVLGIGGGGEEAFAEVGGEFVQVVDELVDAGFKDFGHGHGRDGDEESGDGGEESGPDAIGEVARGDGLSEFGDF